jgi:ubiquinone/menaquinone biosynthesis C-methylase UbiE
MKKIFCGNEIDRMPDFAFKMMAFIFNISDKLKSPDKKLDPFKIQMDMTVIDYGCGTGRYLRSASERVGIAGKVYAVDIHELAIESANRVIKQYNLANVITVLTDGTTVDILSHTADLIYALDMFHMVSDTDSFLNELCRITKPDGIMYLEDGHQPRKLAKEKVNNSGRWTIIEETKKYMKCKLKKQTS